jgi:hypothetical protein
MAKSWSESLLFPFLGEGARAVMELARGFAQGKRAQCLARAEAKYEILSTKS